MSERKCPKCGAELIAHTANNRRYHLICSQCDYCTDYKTIREMLDSTVQLAARDAELAITKRALEIAVAYINCIAWVGDCLPQSPDGFEQQTREELGK